MTTCVQILEGSSVPGDFEVWKLLPNRLKGTKRGRPDAAAGGQGAYRHLSSQASMRESGRSGDSGNHQTSGLQSDPSGTKSQAGKDSESDE